MDIILLFFSQQQQQQFHSWFSITISISMCVRSMFLVRKDNEGKKNTTTTTTTTVAQIQKCKMNIPYKSIAQTHHSNKNHNIDNKRWLPPEKGNKKNGRRKSTNSTGVDNEGENDWEKASAHCRNFCEG